MQFLIILTARILIAELVFVTNLEPTYDIGLLSILINGNAIQRLRQMNGIAHLMMLSPALSIVSASDCLHIHKLNIITRGEDVSSTSIPKFLSFTA